MLRPRPAPYAVGLALLPATLRRLRGRARRAGRGLYARRVRGGGRIVYGVRRGRVRYVAVASRSVARSTRRLRTYIRLAGLR